MACKQFTDGSGGITKLISACSNTIMAKVRSRLSECVSTLLSWYLLLCHSTPAIWPAAAPAACASFWWNAAAEAVGTWLAGDGTSPFPPFSYFLRSPLPLQSSSKSLGSDYKGLYCPQHCSLPVSRGPWPCWRGWTIFRALLSFPCLH